MTDRDMTQHPDPQVDLDAFFQAARHHAPDPSGDLMARLEAQALAEQPIRRAADSRAAPGLWRQLAQALGGWQGGAGLATACAAGLWLGFSPLADVSTWLELLGAQDDIYAIEPLSGYDLAMMEG